MNKEQWEAVGMVTFLFSICIIVFIYTNFFVGG